MNYDENLICCLKDFENKKITQEDLIIKLKQMRAFSYDDQIKLIILDKMPCSIWAADKSCTITFWDGKCERIYGLPKNQAIGYNYLDLFVSKDDFPTAKHDHQTIINGRNLPFYKLAEDHKPEDERETKKISLFTVCERIVGLNFDNNNLDNNTSNKDENYWLVEMGFPVDVKTLLQDYQSMLAQNILVQERYSKFLTDSSNNQIVIINKKDEINKLIPQYTSILFKHNKTSEEISKIIENYKNEATKIKKCLDAKIEEYGKKIQNSATQKEAVNNYIEYQEEYEKIKDGINRIIETIEFEISKLTECQEQTISLCEMIHNHLLDDAWKFQMSVNSTITKYLSHGLTEDDETIKKFRDLEKEINSFIIVVQNMKKKDNELAKYQNLMSELNKLKNKYNK